MSEHGECVACKKRFRTAIAEAKHRHNFPALCVRNKAFAEWEKQIRNKPIDTPETKE